MDYYTEETLDEHASAAICSVWVGDNEYAGEMATKAAHVARTILREAGQLYFCQTWERFTNVQRGGGVLVSANILEGAET